MGAERRICDHFVQMDPVVAADHDGATRLSVNPVRAAKAFAARLTLFVGIAVAGGMIPACPAAAAGTDTLVWDIAAGPQYADPVMGTAAQANVMVVQNVYE